jgi:chromosome condensin MukBEF ATPase and DNA-binding subunit MukB
MPGKMSSLLKTSFSKKSPGRETFTCIELEASPRFTLGVFTGAFGGGVLNPDVPSGGALLTGMALTASSALRAASWDGVDLSKEDLVRLAGVSPPAVLFLFSAARLAASSCCSFFDFLEEEPMKKIKRTLAL